MNPGTLKSKQITLELNITDANESYLLHISNGVLIGEENTQASKPDISITGIRKQMRAFFLAKRPLQEMPNQGLQVDGDKDLLAQFQSAIEMPPTYFPIVRP